MMLLAKGIGKQSEKWHITEKKAPMYARIYSVLGGDTMYRSENFTQVLRKNWLYIFPACIPYEMITNPNDPLKCMFLHLDIQTLSLSRPIAVNLNADFEMNHYIQVIYDAIERGYPDQYLEALTCGFQQLCVAKHLFELPDAQTSCYMELLQKNYCSDMSVAEMAASVGYSTEYFIRSFKKRLGVSPHQYAIGLRMNDAACRLRGDASLTEIAEAVGYADDQSFSKAFRHYYGMSPGAYRRQYASVYLTEPCSTERDWRK